LDNKSAGISYETAATMAIFPINNPEIVDSLIKYQGWEGDKKFVVKIKENSNINYPFPEIFTIREALMKFCDLTSLLQKSQLNKLMEHAKNKAKFENYINDYDNFRKSYKKLAEIIKEEEIKLSFSDFIQISSRMIVFL